MTTKQKVPCPRYGSQQDILAGPPCRVLRGLVSEGAVAERTGPVAHAPLATGPGFARDIHSTLVANRATLTAIPAVPAATSCAPEARHGQQARPERIYDRAAGQLSIPAGSGAHRTARRHTSSPGRRTRRRGG
jgi:hypothetical protein